MTEHRTRVDVIQDEGFQLICSCGYTGKLRKNKFDAGEDEIAHHHTGAGPRTRAEIADDEGNEGLLARVREAMNGLRN